MNFEERMISIIERLAIIDQKNLDLIRDSDARIEKLEQDYAQLSEAHAQLLREKGSEK